MKKTSSFSIFALVLALLSTTAIRAQKGVEANVRLYHVAIDGDTIDAKRELHKIQFDEVSELVEIGKAGKRSYFIKMEILESHLNDGGEYFIVVQLYEQFDKKAEKDPFHRSVSERFVVGKDDDINLGMKKNKGNHSISQGKTGPDGKNENFYIDYDLRFRWLD